MWQPPCHQHGGQECHLSEKRVFMAVAELCWAARLNKGIKLCSGWQPSGSCQQYNGSSVRLTVIYQRTCALCLQTGKTITNTWAVTLICVQSILSNKSRCKTTLSPISFGQIVLTVAADFAVLCSKVLLQPNARDLHSRETTALLSAKGDGDSAGERWGWEGWRGAPSGTLGVQWCLPWPKTPS